MKTVSIHDAKTNLSKYIAAAKRGEKVYIGNRGKPEVRLVAETPKIAKRKFGVLHGKVGKLPDLEVIDNSSEWQSVVGAMNSDNLSDE